MILHQRGLRYTVYFQSFISVERDPSQLEEVKEILQVLLQNDIHAAFLLVVKAKHEFVRSRAHTLDHVVQVFNIQNRFHLQIQSTFIHNQNLVSCQHNDSINLPFSKLVQFNDRLEVHDGMVSRDEFLELLLSSLIKILHLFLDKQIL